MANAAISFSSQYKEFVSREFSHDGGFDKSLNQENRIRT